MDAAEIRGDGAVARWSTSDSSGVIARGTVLLRVVGARWAVTAATTADVDLGDLAFDGSRVAGTVRSVHDDLLAVDVLDPTGAPLGAPPRGSGGQEVEDPFGTAGEGRRAVEVDVPVPGGPAIVLVRLVGGTFLSVSELRLDPPATRIVQLAAGAGQEPAWELVATDEATGHWVTLRAPQMTGTFRLQADGPVTTPYLQIGPCCELEDHILVAGALRRDATGLQLVLGDGTTIAAPAVEDPGRGARYAVIAVPRSRIPADATARVEIRIGDELVDSGLDFDLTPIGG